MYEIRLYENVGAYVANVALLRTTVDAANGDRRQAADECERVTERLAKTFGRDDYWTGVLFFKAVCPDTGEWFPVQVIAKDGRFEAVYDER